MASRSTNAKNPDGDSNDVNGVGALLQASRLKLGDDLRFVAETLHIRFIYLEAIEAGRFDDLPGAAYAIGFIRSYADYLGLDSEEVVRRYKTESAPQLGNPELVFPVPIPESSIPGGAIIFVGVVVAILAYGGWYVSTAKDGFMAGLVSPVPERLSEEKQVQEPEIDSEPVETESVEKPAEPVQEVQQESELLPVTPVQTTSGEPAQTPAQPEPVEQATQEVTEAVEEAVQETTTPEIAAQTQETVQEAATAETGAVAQVVSEQVEEAASSQSVAETTEETPAPVETASTPDEPEPASTSRVYGSENDSSRILVRARKNSWIQVRDNNSNRLVMTRLMRAGDSYRVPDQTGLVLLTGNAGALEILVDGVSVPDLGEAGKVRRNVALDPDLLRQGTAAQ